MSVCNPIPSSINVLGFACRAWHPGQPVHCTICKESGHSPGTCPLSGLCRRCKQPGHVARECGQARSQPRFPSSVPVPRPSPVPPPLAPKPDPVSVFVSEYDGDSSSVSSDHRDSPVSPLSSPSVSISQVPVFPVSPDVPLPSCSATAGDLDVSMASESSGVGSRRVQSSDYKRLVRLTVPKIKTGSELSTVKKLCLSLIKSHKLNVTDEECVRIASSICSRT